MSCLFFTSVLNQGNPLIITFDLYATNFTWSRTLLTHVKAQGNYVTGIWRANGGDNAFGFPMLCQTKICAVYVPAVIGIQD